MKIRILVLFILLLGLTVTALSQKISVSPFGTAQLGYGAFRGYTDPNYNFITSGITVDQSTYRIFRGADFSVGLGVALHRPGSDIYRETYFDVWLVHKRLTSSSNAVRFTGAGFRVRYQFFYAGLVLGVAGNRNELPVELDLQNNTLNSGNINGVTPMFNLGLRAPLNSGHTLFLDIPFELVIPRNHMNDEPSGSTALYEWYSLSLGICYFLPV